MADKAALNSLHLTFGNPATISALVTLADYRSVALRPRLSAGLPLSAIISI